MNTVDFLASATDYVSPGISACQGCMAEHALRTVVKVLGPKTVIGIPPGCMAGAGVGGWNLAAGLSIPSTMTQLGNSASMMAGIKAAYNLVDPDVNVLAFSGDGATADIGLQALSAAAERKDNIIYVCYDNEGYMNTGFQKSGTTPHGARTSTTPVGVRGSGKPNFKKDLAMMMAMQNAAYVATLSCSHMNDFVHKVETAKQIKDGLSFLHILSPCPTGWGYEPCDSIKYATMAVKSGYFPLYEYRDYKFTISAPTKNLTEPLDVTKFLEGQKRFAHLDDEAIDATRNYVENKLAQLKRLAAT